MKKKDKAPRSHKLKGRAIPKGLIIVHTGNGKGKSTAAFGTALRALGRGYKVAVVQFIKGKWKTGEEMAASFFRGRYRFFGYGKGFTWQTKNFEHDAALARKTWEKCLEVLHDPAYHLVIFDEINYCLQYNFLTTREVCEALLAKPAGKHVILTGNGAPRALKKLADLVTEMKCVKHPYTKGILAQPGIEF